MNLEDFLLKLGQYTESDSFLERSAISSALLRNYSISTASNNLIDSLNHLIDSLPELSEKSYNDFLRHIENQAKILKLQDFSENEMPVRTNKLSPLFSELNNIITSKHDSDPASFLLRIPHFPSYSGFMIPDHGKEGEYLGNSLGTVSINAMLSALIFFGGREIVSRLNVNSPVVKIYDLKHDKEYNPEISYINNESLIIPHQQFAFGRGGTSRGLLPKDCGSWVQEVISLTENKFPLSTADWFGALVAPRFFPDTAEFLSSRNWYRDDAGSNFLTENYTLIENPDEVKPGDIFLTKSIKEDDSGIKKLMSSGHIGIVSNNIVGSEVRVISSNRNADSESIGTIDGIGYKNYQVTPSGVYFFRQTPQRDVVSEYIFNEKLEFFPVLIQDIQKISETFGHFDSELSGIHTWNMDYGF